MQTNAYLIPLVAVIALLLLTWYLLAMPAYLQNSRGIMASPSSAVVLEAGY